MYLFWLNRESQQSIMGSSTFSVFTQTFAPNHFKLANKNVFVEHQRVLILVGHILTHVRAELTITVS